MQFQTLVCVTTTPAAFFKLHFCLIKCFNRTFILHFPNDCVRAVFTQDNEEKNKTKNLHIDVNKSLKQILEHIFRASLFKILCC